MIDPPDAGAVPAAPQINCMQIVKGSERWFCRVEGCNEYTWTNQRFGYCEQHAAAFLQGEVLKEKLGFPRIGSGDPVQINEISQDTWRARAERAEAQLADLTRLRERAEGERQQAIQQLQRIERLAQQWKQDAKDDLAVSTSTPDHVHGSAGARRICAHEVESILRTVPFEATLAERGASPKESDDATR